MSDPNPITGTVVEAGALEVISRAEIDMQIATAHRYPRSLATFKKRAIEMVSMDEDTAESCIYRRPVGKKKNEATGQWEESYAEGMSIRMAEIVGACFGNLRVVAMVVEQTDRYVKARGMAHDLESNFASSSEFIEPTVDKHGKPYSERQRAVVAKAAASKARRDATFQVVPRALCRPIEEMARQIAIGDATTLVSRRTAVIQWIAKIGVDPARVYAALGIAGMDDIGTEQLTTLTGLKTAIKDGEISVDEAFPKEAAPIIDKPRAKTEVDPHDPKPEPLKDEIAPESALTFVRNQLKATEITEAELCRHFKLEKLEAVKVSELNTVLKWIKSPGP